MVLFWRLLLAHLIADFPLQTDAVFAVKKGRAWGVMLHSTLFWLTAILLAKPFLHIWAVWGGLVLLWLSHSVIDKAKLALVSSGRKDHLVYFLLDQLLHIGAVALVCLFLNRIPQVSAIAASVLSIKIGIAYVVSVWVSPLLCFYTRTAFSSQKVDFQRQQSVCWRVIGSAERLLITAVAAAGGRLFIILPLVFFPRIGLSIFTRQSKFSRWELILGSTIAVAAGFWVRTLK
ncbi:DUF3307 domain-containing protein [Candidatus Zixiibacteriota bacterium]